MTSAPEHRLLTSPKTSRRMSKVRQTGTNAETALRKELFKAGLRYRVNVVVLANPRRVADVAFSTLKLAIFADGCFWHGCPTHATWPKSNAAFWRSKIEQNRARDDDTDERLRNSGWVILRFWEHESPSDCATAVAMTVDNLKKSLPRTESSGRGRARKRSSELHKRQEVRHRKKNQEFA